MLVLPGFVETHWHLWTNAAAQPRRRPARARLLSRRRAPSARSTPPTTCTPRAGWPPPRRFIRASRSLHDWCHNVRGPDYAEAALRALEETGIRARFSYGSPTGASNDASIDLRDLARLREALARPFERRLVDAGARVARRGIGGDVARLRGRERAPFADLRAREQFPEQRRRHPAARRRAACSLRACRSFTPSGARPRKIRALADNRVNVSVSPYSELRIGFGYADRRAPVAAGVTVGLSVDTTDAFAAMRTCSRS